MTEQTQIEFVNKEKDNGVMVGVIQSVYDLQLEIQSAQEIIKDKLDKGFEKYKETVDPTSKVGDYKAFVKGLVAQMQKGKIAAEVEKLENIMDNVEVVKKYIR